MRCQYSMCYAHVSKPGLCYYHEKQLQGLFDRHLYEERRLRAHEYYVTHGGLNNKPFEGLEILCSIGTKREISALNKDREVWQHNELVMCIAISNAIVARRLRESSQKDGANDMNAQIVDGCLPLE